MFTGLVEKTAIVTRFEANAGLWQLELSLAEADQFATLLGESIAVNGCCLTVVRREPSTLVFELSHETLAKTNFAKLKAGQYVNLERALKLGDRLGGHMVSGHVDGIANIQAISQTLDSWDIWLAVDLKLSRYLIDKGSLTVDGISLTINELKDESDRSLVRLTLIPHTLQVTTAQYWQTGQVLNLEVDILGKYLERLSLRKF